ncbi:MAG: hypothetical protein HY318_04935 [Armatimonadetes bacterium]|nr:hypothetical protein [Armatimonadota bacterium]
MKRLLLLVAGLLIAGHVGNASASDSSLVYSASKVAQPPTIDGKLDEECWQSAEQTGPFVKIGGSNSPVETRGRLCWDEGRLYIALVCGEPRMDTLRERLQRGPVAPTEESIEIFIDSDYDQFTYLQFRVGVQGERDTHRGNDMDDSLTARWRGAAAVNADNWTVEAAIPFALLGRKPSPRALWGLNLNRQRCLEPQVLWTCWSDTQGGFHSPSRFGHLVFTGYADWLQNYYGGRAADTLEELMDLMAKHHLRYDSETRAALERLLEDFKRDVTAQNPTTASQCSPLCTSGETLLKQFKDALAGLRLEVIRNEFG